MNSCLRLAVAVFATTCSAIAQNTAFTYQGRLHDNAGPANGAFTFSFELYATPSGGPPIGLPYRANTEVSNGLFIVTVDFGLPVFDGTARWLQIQVAPKEDEGNFTTLTPRQALTPTPYALFAPTAGTALTVPDGSITSNKLAAGAVTSASLAPNSVTATQLAPGAAAANLIASGISGVPSSGVVMSLVESNESLLQAGFNYLRMAMTNSPATNSSLPPGPPPTGTLSSGRYGHRAVWSGTEMLIIGGTPDGAGLRYNPAGNSWSLMNKSNAPALGEDLLVAWSGSQLIAWDTYNRVGARYSPATDTWTTMTDVGAPSARLGACAAYAGGYFVVWGGSDPSPSLYSFLNTGARYNPANNTWTAMSTVNAPQRRAFASATTAGSEILVVGGLSTNEVTDCGFGGCVTDLNYETVNTAARYNPAANSWTSISNGPSRLGHTAVWTGVDLYVWGGVFRSGGYGFSMHGNPVERGMKYNLAGNTWTLLSTNGAPGTPHVGWQTAVWSGSNLVVWGLSSADGGFYRSNYGARYIPLSDSWIPLPVNSLEDREEHTAVWSGSQMIVWGGKEPGLADGLANGARYNPSANNWSTMTTPPATGEPSERSSAAGVWTGDALIIWGGNNGGTYLRSGGLYRHGVGWTNTPDAGAPSPRFGHTAVWTGTEMIVWGGTGPGSKLNTGARFHLGSNRWFSMTTSNAPRRRTAHVAVWTGREMIVFGGYDTTNLFYPTFLNSAARYNPSNDTWTAISNNIFIIARAGATAVWTGKEMIFWGGYSHDGGIAPTYSYFNSGGRFNPESNLWFTVASSGLSGRRYHSAVWSGEEMIVWGGYGASGPTNTGARYNPNSNTWTPVPTNGAPAARSEHSAVWDSGRQIMLVGGGDPARFGYSFDPHRNVWTLLTANDPGFASSAVAVWDGTQMLLSTGRDTLFNEQNALRTLRPAQTYFFYQKP